MFCSSCGEKRRAGSKFCPGCGMEFSEVAVSTSGAGAIMNKRPQLRSKNKMIVAGAAAVLLIVILVIAFSRNSIQGTWSPVGFHTEMSASGQRFELIFGRSNNFWMVEYDRGGRVDYIIAGTYSISGNRITGRDGDGYPINFRIEGNRIVGELSEFERISSRRTPP